MLPTPPPSPRTTLACSPEDRIGQVLAGCFELVEILGAGAYGTVYRARDIETDVQYAVKALTKVNLDPRQQAFRDREIQLHYAASQHPNVVSLVQILESPDCTFVVMEFCPEGDLFSKITDHGQYIGDDVKTKQVFLQILSAVQHCHANGIYHRDLKPENIMVMDNGWIVKLADFGLATQDRITSDFGCGSTFYMSPECQTSKPKPYACYASAPNDIWALGVVLVNLTCGRNPWKRASLEDSTFRAFMRDRHFLKSILPISDELNCILQRIFEANPLRRIGIEELRDMVLRCQRFTNQPGTPAMDSCALPTPPASPVDKAVDSPMLVVNGAFQPVPHLEPLPPAQHHYPSSSTFRYSHPANQPHPHPHQQLLTPPNSGPCTPEPPQQYTFPPPPVSKQQPQQQQAVAAQAQPFGVCAPFYDHMADLRRCGQMLSSFNMPCQFWAVTR